MGKTNSRSQHNRLNLNYEVLSTQVNKDTHQQLILRTFSLEAINNNLGILPILSRTKVLQHEHILPIIQFDVNDDSSISVLSVAPVCTLQDERNQRIAQGFAYLQHNNLKYSAVRARNVIVEKNGQTRIAHPLTMLQQSNYQRYRESKGHIVNYLSPKELQGIRQGLPKANHNPFKSDVFSLGVVILDLALLRSHENLYTLSQTLNMEGLAQSMGECQRKYGREFMMIMQLMIQPDETRRLDWIQLEGFMKKTQLQSTPLPVAVTQLRQQALVNPNHIVYTNQIGNAQRQVHTSQNPQSYIVSKRKMEPAYYSKPSTQSADQQRRSQLQHSYPQRAPSEASAASASVKNVPLDMRYVTSKSFMEARSPSPQKRILPSELQFSPQQAVQFLNPNMIHYQIKPARQSQIIQVGNQLHQHQRMTSNVTIQQSSVAKTRLSVTDNINMHKSHHFDNESQHQSQGRVQVGPMIYTPDQKLMKQVPVIQQQFARQDQQHVGNYSMTNNRIAATNINRDRSQAKPQTSVSNKAPVTFQSPFSSFNKKASFQSEQSIPASNQLQQSQKTIVVPHLTQASSFQSHTHPTKVMTAETKKFFEKQRPLKEKHTQVNPVQPSQILSPPASPSANINISTLFESNDSEYDTVLPTFKQPEFEQKPVIQSTSTPSASNVQSQQETSSLFVFQLIPPPPTIILLPPQTSMPHVSNYMNNTNKLINDNSNMHSFNCSENATSEVYIPLSPSPPIEVSAPRLHNNIISDLHQPAFVSHKTNLDDTENLNFQTVFCSEEEKQPQSNSKAIVQSELSIIDRERKDLVDDLQDRFADKAEQLKLNDSYGYSNTQSNIKQDYESSVNRWSELKLQLNPSDKSKLSTLKRSEYNYTQNQMGHFGAEASNAFELKKLKYPEEKVSIEIQTSPQASSRISSSPRNVNRDIQYSEKMVSTSTLRIPGYFPRNVPAQLAAIYKLRVQPKYEGQTLKGFRHGYGKYVFEDGSYYEGHWSFNRMQGQGKLYYVSGKLAYNGGWSQDQFHGSGKLFNECPRYTQSIDYKDFSKAGHSWKSYEGNFDYDQRSGTGILTFENNENFTGSFEADKVHGEGVFTGKTRIIHGYWQNDQLKSVL